MPSGPHIPDSFSLKLVRSPRKYTSSVNPLSMNRGRQFGSNYSKHKYKERTLYSKKLNLLKAAKIENQNDVDLEEDKLHLIISIFS